LRIQQSNLFACKRQMCLDLLSPTEGVAARVGFDLRAVQRHAFHGDQSFGAEHAQHLHQ
jgi:hypothetical protein